MLNIRRCQRCKIGKVDDLGDELVCTSCGAVTEKIADLTKKAPSELGNTLGGRVNPQELTKMGVTWLAARMSLEEVGERIVYQKVLNELLGSFGFGVGSAVAIDAISTIKRLLSEREKGNLVAGDMNKNKKRRRVPVSAIAAYAVFVASKSSQNPISLKTIKTWMAEHHYPFSARHVTACGFTVSPAREVDHIRTSVRWLSREGYLQNGEVGEIMKTAYTIAASVDPEGRSPRTIAASAVYAACRRKLLLRRVGRGRPTRVSHAVAAESVGLAEYTVRETYCKLFAKPI